MLDDGTNVAKLCVQYEGGTTDKVSASESKKGLLGALQESEVFIAFKIDLFMIL